MLGYMRLPGQLGHASRGSGVLRRVPRRTSDWRYADRNPTGKRSGIKTMKILQMMEMTVRELPRSDQHWRSREGAQFDLLA